MALSRIYDRAISTLPNSLGPRNRRSGWMHDRSAPQCRVKLSLARFCRLIAIIHLPRLIWHAARRHRRLARRSLSPSEHKKTTPKWRMERRFADLSKGGRESKLISHTVCLPLLSRRGWRGKRHKMMSDHTRPPIRTRTQYEGVYPLPSSPPFLASLLTLRRLRL